MLHKEKQEKKSQQDNISEKSSTFYTTILTKIVYAQFTSFNSRAPCTSNMSSMVNCKWLKYRNKDQLPHLCVYNGMQALKVTWGHFFYTFTLFVEIVF
jgi:hypothetical protein